MKRLIFTATILLGSFNTLFSQDLNKATLCKKWQLDKYVIFWISYSPEANEQNDYLDLKPNMTYTSIDEGQLSGGRWTYNDAEDYFILYDESKGSNDGMKFIVEKLSDDRLVVEIEHKDMEGVDIHFVTQ